MAAALLKPVSVLWSVDYLFGAIHFLPRATDDGGDNPILLALRELLTLLYGCAVLQVGARARSNDHPHRIHDAESENAGSTILAVGVCTSPS